MATVTITKTLTPDQIKSLYRIARGRKVTVVRFFPDMGVLQVGWKAKPAGMIYRWVGQNGKFVSK